MQKPDIEKGLSELRAARRSSRRLFWAVGIFSFFVNLLMLTGPIFMLQVYDRVLGSRSEETLLALFIIMAFLFAMMGLLDFVRGRVLARIGAKFQDGLDRRVFAAVLKRSSIETGHERAGNALRDLESVQKLLASPVFAALFDIPWTPVFLIGITIFHPWLGVLAVLGGSCLILVTFLNQAMTKNPVLEANQSAFHAELFSEQMRNEAEMIRSMGMQGAAFARWNALRQKALGLGLRSSDQAGGFTTLSKTFRLFLQSAMLGLGAYLVLTADLTPGAMIAASILLGRALAPLDLAIGQWPAIQRAMKGWQNLGELLGTIAEEPQRTQLPVPAAKLSVQQLTRGAARRAGRLAAADQLRGGPGPGGGRDRAQRLRQDHAGPRHHRCLARRGRQDPARRRGAGPLRPRRAGPLHRLPAAARAAVRRHHHREHLAPQSPIPIPRRSSAPPSAPPRMT